MSFILVLMQMYVVVGSMKLFPLSSCLQRGGHVCCPFFSELQRIPFLLLFRAMLITCVGMGAVNSFTLLHSEQDKFSIVKVWVMREAVTVCIRRCLSRFKICLKDCLCKISIFWNFLHHLKGVCCFKEKKRKFGSECYSSIMWLVLGFNYLYNTGLKT